MHTHKPRRSAPEVFLLALAVVLCLAVRVGAQPTTFTYQGRLTDSGVSANGLYDFQFCIRDAFVDGDPVGTTNTLALVMLSNGFFSVTLDFGGQVFDGSARWIEIAVRTNGSVLPYVTLSPRQPVLPTPYAIRATALSGLRTETNAFSPNVVGGFGGNTVTAGRVGATIAGGGTTISGVLYPNTVGADFGTVGGGWANSAGGNSSIIGGGFGNTIHNASDATIGGGRGNIIESAALYSHVGGGHQNLVRAGATAGTVPGGQQNVVGGSYGFAAGRRAKAESTGAFVWADSTDADFTSTASNQFLIRANGGVGIGLNNPQSALEVAGTVRATAFQGNGAGLAGVTPGGVAGGGLSGTYPNPVIANSVITSAQIADGTITDADISGTANISGSKIGSGQVVKSLNALKDAVSITAGANISVMNSGNSIQISSTGGATLSSLGIKSGTITGATSSQYLLSNVVFSSPHPNANYSVTITPRRASASGTLLQPSATYTNKTAAGFTAVIFASSASSISVTADWIAVPYNN